MEKVKYNPELFDLVKELVMINNSIIFQKENENVVVRRADSAVTIAYSLKAPKEYFDFPEGNDNVSFYNYGEFYQYLKAFNQPDIFIDNNKATLKENKSKIDYVLSNPESFESKSPKEPNFGESNIQFKFKPEDHDEIIKMITLIKPKKAKIVGNSKKVTVSIFNDLHDNTFEKNFEVIDSKGDTDMDFLIFSDTFMQIPAKREYIFNIKQPGYMKISLVSDKIGLDIYTGKVKTN